MFVLSLFTQSLFLVISHDEFKKIYFEKYYNARAVVYDIKSFIDRRSVDCRL